MILTDHHIKEARRLGNAIDKGFIPVNEIKHFLNGLQRNSATAAPARKAEERSNKYRLKIRGGKV